MGEGGGGLVLGIEVGLGFFGHMEGLGPRVELGFEGKTC